MSNSISAEIKAMGDSANAISGLDEDARSRVLQWLISYFQIDTTSDTSTLASSGDETTPPQTSYSHFGDLFATVDPKTNEDKALVAAYWRQIILGEETWQSALLQKDLRDLGEALSNISDALSGAVEKRPQKVIQLKKSGQSKQARKTFKLSEAGIKYVEDMMC